MTAYTSADVAALTSVTCRRTHGLAAPERPCFGCRAAAERLLDVVADGIAHRAKIQALREAAEAIEETPWEVASTEGPLRGADDLTWLHGTECAIRFASRLTSLRADSLERAL